MGGEEGKEVGKRNVGYLTLLFQLTTRSLPSFEMNQKWTKNKKILTL